MKKIPEHIEFTPDPGININRIIQKDRPDKVGVLVDENTRTHCLPRLEIAMDDLFEIKSGEKHKTLDTCSLLWQKLTEAGFSRKSLLINLGGGVIGDMGGFIASTYKRGMRFINIPTTLLAQVDASIGGKLGIDFHGYKNHIGLFREPDQIIISSIFLETLSKEQLRSGFAEVIKHALIRDYNYWEAITSSTDLNKRNWDEIIHTSVRIKSDVVESDPLEKGFRKILNFGHTLGHAIETWKLLKSEELLHGEAIAIGMIMETRLSELTQKLDSGHAQSIYSYIKNMYPNVTLPPLAEIYSLLKQDKKNEKGEVNFSLLNKIGKCDFNVKVTDELIEDAYFFYEKLYK